MGHADPHALLSFVQQSTPNLDLQPGLMTAETQLAMQELDAYLGATPSSSYLSSQPQSPAAILHHTRLYQLLPLLPLSTRIRLSSVEGMVLPDGSGTADPTAVSLSFDRMQLQDSHGHFYHTLKKWSISTWEKLEQEAEVYTPPNHGRPHARVTSIISNLVFPKD